MALPTTASLPRCQDVEVGREQWAKGRGSASIFERSELTPPLERDGKRATLRDLGTLLAEGASKQQPLGG